MITSGKLAIKGLEFTHQGLGSRRRLVEIDSGARTDPVMVRRAIPINIPNSLTLLRILLTPLFAICLIRHLWVAALLVFAIAAITDGLDGFVARVYRQKTMLGTYLDPVADKFLLLTAFITLAVQGFIPSWLAVIVMTRDMVILFGVALLNIMDRDFEARPSILSKITTVAQLATVCSVLVGFQVPKMISIQSTLFWFTAAMTVVSGLQYIYRGLSILQEETPNTVS
ncbi:MAG: CDP-alcohol phosphatidyltransferase family protein [Thermodesulfobacteriota bacterium]|nr:CDP-alcohol phosphatidyltransferase family protein [Thermodesulfobacteriota bacterium]